MRSKIISIVLLLSIGLTTGAKDTVSQVSTDINSLPEKQHNERPNSSNNLILSTDDVQNSVKMGNANGGGGGDALVFPLGEAHIADTYSQIDVYHDHEITFSSKLKERLDTLGGLKRFYLVRAKDDTLGVGDSRSAFYAVENLPDDPICNKRLKYKDLPDKAYVEQVACTIGTETWIRMSIFERMRLDDQALLIFHEDLRRNKNSDDVTIATIINGMIVAVKNLNLQLNSTEISALSEKDQTMMRRMFRSLQIAYGASPTQARQIAREHILTPYGGIFHGSAEQLEKMADGVTLGIGTYLENGSEVGEKSILVNTNICRKSCIIGSNTVIKQAYGFEFIYDDSENTRYSAYWELTTTDNKNIIRIGSNVVITNMFFELNKKIIASLGVFVYRSPSFTIADGAHVTGVRLDPSGSTFKIGENAKINTLTLESSVDVIIEPSSEISDLTIGARTEYSVHFSGVIKGDKNFRCMVLNRDANGTAPKGLLKFLRTSTSIKINSIADIARISRNCTDK